MGHFPTSRVGSREGEPNADRDHFRPGALPVTRVTVWHDGGCPLCAREITLMRRLYRHGRIDFVDATSASCPLDRAEMPTRLHAREGDGPLLSGAAAFAAMWRAIPSLRPIGLLARNRHALSILEFLYRRFLRLRPRLQRLAARAGV